MSFPFGKKEEKKENCTTMLSCIKDYERAMKIFQIDDVDLTEGEISTISYFAKDGKSQETRIFQDHPIC